MMTAKSFTNAFQEAGWLMIVVLICVATRIASSMFVAARVTYLRQLASRYQ
jgi:hypothetical protein